MTKGTIICLCDLTGIFAEPWLNDGYSTLLIDPQHNKSSTENHKAGGTITKIANVIDSDETWAAIRNVKNPVFVAGFPPCTDVAVSGARWFKDKAKDDPAFQIKAALVAEQCKNIGKMLNVPWFFENPVSVFSSIFGKPNYTFHPHYFTGYCHDDNYTKKTCIWAGNGFVMPDEYKNELLCQPDDRIHKASPSPERANFRSATPRGFSTAVYLANSPIL
ncbi:MULTISPECIES: hypothetical protein [unclassified Photorhabdus]|uniref:hypothetical protein n=1 Tax=unclassified Photorhabdus TaxID=2620880 RepID=UPI000DCB283D|nr:MULTISPECIES: hypothetical protein [unclassified Photorhabdus]RAW91287.1 hypothetical protein CKY03_24165 [Photorhabdus sp. S9-53]RAW91291.1 hypothetical protein CKY05_24115 [Photorhabdus sp. S10-54]RAW94649.1 hypothetical protein CKY04_24390 [Photorhabdus sp. S8-52]